MMIMNQVKLTGRVSWMDIKYTENGNAIATIILGVKRNQEKWDNFFIKFFDTKTKNLAEDVISNINKGDYIQVIGKLVEQSFVPKGWENLKDENGNQKTVSKTEIVGKIFKKVYYNEESEQFDFIGE